MTPNTIDAAEMGRDHERWGTDQANWLRDVYRWQKEHESALAELKRLEAIVTAHADEVRNHAEKIVAHEKARARHARVISEAKFTDVLDDPMATYHRHVGIAHAKTDEAHTRLKEHHKEVTLQLSALRRSVEQKA